MMTHSATTERQFAFHGTVIKRDEEHLSVRVFPGLVLDIREADIAELEEAEDEVTRRTYVYIRLKDDADITANFKPRLARLALASERGVPFEMGGTAHTKGHALPSGGVPSIPPFIDAEAVRMLSSRLPPETWGALMSAATTLRAGTKKTDTETNPHQTVVKTTRMGPTSYKTLVPGSDPPQTINDSDFYTVIDEEKKDFTTDTVDDPSGW